MLPIVALLFLLQGHFWFATNVAWQIWCDSGSRAEPVGGSGVSLIVTLFTHFHQNSTILYREFPHWQVGNGHSHDGMALKRQDIPRSARLRREHTAPEEQHQSTTPTELEYAGTAQISPT